MTLYFVLLAIPSVLALLRVPASAFFMTIVGLIYIVIGGLRYHVGMDWFNYERLHGDVDYMSFYELFKESEPLSYLLFKSSNAICDCMALTNVFSAAILTGGIFLFASQTPAPWIGIVSATPYLYIAFGFSGIRQAIGVGISLIVFAFWNRRSLLTTFPLIGIGTLFHSSVAVIAMFYAVSFKATRALKIFFTTPLFIVIGFVLYRALSSQDTVQLYSDRYIASSDADSAGALFHVAFIAIPAFAFFLLRRRIMPYLKYPDLVWWGGLGGLLLVPLTLISSTGASRLSLYFYFVPISVYPALCSLFRTSLDSYTTIAIVVMHFLILYVWFAFANNSSAHIPYQNMLFL